MYQNIDQSYLSILSNITDKTRHVNRKNQTCSLLIGRTIHPWIHVQCANQVRIGSWVISTHICPQFTPRKMKFSIKDFFSKSDQTRSFLRVWSHLLKKSLMENFSFCAVVATRSCPWFQKFKDKQTHDHHHQHIDILDFLPISMKLLKRLRRQSNVLAMVKTLQIK